MNQRVLATTSSLLFVLAACGGRTQDERADVASASLTATCEPGTTECCPAGLAPRSLTDADDTLADATPDVCIAAHGGRDTIFSAPRGANARAAVLGGPGDDTITVVSSGSTVYGGAGNDTIFAGNGLVVPGPGIDTVDVYGTNNTVAIYDACEISAGERYASDGAGTLVTPLTATELASAGVSVTGFARVVVTQSSCLSSCVAQPDCSGHGACAEGAARGQVVCACDAGFVGDHCEQRDPAADVTPFVQCVLPADDGYIAWFGYENKGAAAADAPVGPSNHFGPIAANQEQPTHFRVGRFEYDVTAPFDAGASVTWRLGGGSATATKDSPACPPELLGEGEDDAEDGDVVKFTPEPPADLATLTKALSTASTNTFPRVTLPVVASPDAASSAPSNMLLVGDERGSRAVEVVLANDTNLQLDFVEGEFEGAPQTEPPSAIGPFGYGDLESKNGKALQGTGGHITYRFGANTIHLEWDDPFLGSNSYSATIAGPDASSFTVTQVGGSGNRATVFFILRPASAAPSRCSFESMQWIIDNLRNPEEPLNGFDTASGVITTPAKQITGIKNWAGTGCAIRDAVGEVVAVAHSTDRFFTIDVVLRELEGAYLWGTGKAVRLEVEPGTAAHHAIVDGGEPALNSLIQFHGPVLLDHGSFLEVHPRDPITTAEACADFAPGDPLPLYCNTTLNDFFEWKTGMPPVPMGDATNRVCFLTGVGGAFNSADESVHVFIDPATNAWFLGGTAGADPVLFIPNALPRQIDAHARCVMADWYSDETSWSQGEPFKPLARFTGSRGCFLTRVAGRFEGGGEEVFVNEGDPRGITLGGFSQQVGVGASARCLALKGTSPPTRWATGTPELALEKVAKAPACYLLRVGGKFDSTNEEVHIGAATAPSGTLFWTLSGRSQAGDVFAEAECGVPGPF